MRILLLSTPDFGIPTLHALIARGLKPVGVVCQPDKPAGRGLHLRAPAMKLAAQDCGVPVLQPDNLRAPEALEALADLRPDLILVAAYGKYIPAEVLQLAPVGALNLHPSLLPRWRGACPVPAALLAGDAETGVTIHFVVDEMDAGDILGQASAPLSEEDRPVELMARLAVLGANLYLRTLEGWLAGRIQPTAQDHSRATWCDRLKRGDGRLDWAQPAARLARQVRAYDPWPGAFTRFGGSTLHILDAHAQESLPVDLPPGNVPPGQVFRAGDELAVATGRGALVLRRVQAPGKRALSADEFAAGRRGFATARLG